MSYSRLVSPALALLLAACSGSPASAPGASQPGATAIASGKLAKIYGLGRVWEYESRTATPVGPMTISMRQEVTAVDGARATLKITVTTMGQKSDQTSMVDLSQTDLRAAIAASSSSAGSGTWTQTASGNEDLTVKAGTYPTTRYAGTLKDKDGTMDSTFWINDEVGLVKSITKTQVAAFRLLQAPEGLQLPAGLTVPAAGGGVAAPTGPIQVETTTELTSVSPR